jgi:hypothetical protein
MHMTPARLHSHRRGVAVFSLPPIHIGLGARTACLVHTGRLHACVLLPPCAPLRVPPSPSPTHPHQPHPRPCAVNATSKPPEAAMSPKRAPGPSGGGGGGAGGFDEGSMNYQRLVSMENSLRDIKQLLFQRSSDPRGSGAPAQVCVCVCVQK